MFLYGGYGYFDNMNHYFAGNDYRVVDRTDFPKASVGFANVWGVADEFLYDNSLAQLDRAYAAGKPSMAHIMTTSNHRSAIHSRTPTHIHKCIRHSTDTHSLAHSVTER